MKRIALSLVVIAASGAYVWSQSGSAADDLLGPMPVRDEVPTGSIESRAPALSLAAPVAAAAAVAPVSEERLPRNAWQEHDEGSENERFDEAEDEGEAETHHTISAERIAARLQLPPLPPAPPAPTVPQRTGTVALAEETSSHFPTLEISEASSLEPLGPPPPPLAEARLPRPRPAYHAPAVAKVIPVAMKSGTMTVASNGSYADGTYTGPTVDAYYGLVQIQAIVQDGRLARIKIVRYPSDRLTSVFINRRALPRLRNEAIRAQSARVNIVSGATLTSEAFVRSLDGALREAQGA